MKKHILICLFLSMLVGRGKERGIYYKERNEIITRQGKRKNSNYYFLNEINRFQKIIHILVL